MPFPTRDNVRTAIELADAAGRLASAFCSFDSSTTKVVGAAATITRLLDLSQQAMTVKEPAQAEAIELAVTPSSESAAASEQALVDELVRGDVAAKSVVEHVLAMGANKCELDVKRDGVGYVVSVVPVVAVRTPEDDFAHFLTYSGLHGCSVAVKDLMFKAFQAGQ